MLAERLALPAAEWFHLCRPYFDLGPVRDDAPLHAVEPEVAADDLIAGCPERLGTAMSMTPAFRRMLVAKTGLADYRAASPLELPARLRTPRWQALCDSLDAWSRGDARTRLGAARVLVALTFHRLLASLPASATALEDDAAEAGVAWLQTYARAVTAQRLAFPPSESIEVADRAPRGSLARVFAESFVAAAAIDCAADAATVDAWLERAEQSSEEARLSLEPLDALRLELRMHTLRARRLASSGDAGGADELLAASAQRAEEGAAASRRDRLLLRELRRRIADRRVQVALGSGRLDDAEAHARLSLALDPKDAKAYLLLGEVLYGKRRLAAARARYVEAAHLGPLWAARAWFMVGRCDEALGAGEDALAAYVAAVHADPLSISAALALLRQAHVCRQHALHSWALRIVDGLKRRGVLTAEDLREARQWAAC